MEAIVLEVIKEQIQRRATPDTIGKGFLKLLSATCGFPEVRSWRFFIKHLLPARDFVHFTYSLFHIFRMHINKPYIMVFFYLNYCIEYIVMQHASTMTWYARPLRYDRNNDTLIDDTINRATIITDILDDLWLQIKTDCRIQVHEKVVHQL